MVIRLCKNRKKLQTKSIRFFYCLKLMNSDLLSIDK